MSAAPWKVSNELVTPNLIRHRTEIMEKAGFPQPRYLQFCEWLLQCGVFSVYLHEAQSTRSKYVTIKQLGHRRRRAFKVRFSDHRPNKQREIAGDCDFFVGKSNLGWTNTAAAAAAVNRWCKLNFPVPEAWGKPLDIDNKEFHQRLREGKL